MNIKEIKPKSLVAVLAAAIKEDAESIAQKIVEKAKSDNVEYASLVESFILNKRDEKTITFSSFAEKAFEQIKDVEELKDFSLALRCRWRRKEEPEQFVYETKNEFSIQSDLNIPIEDRWNRCVSVDGNNAYSVFEEFKEVLHRKIKATTSIPTEVDISTEQS